MWIVALLCIAWQWCSSIKSEMSQCLVLHIWYIWSVCVLTLAWGQVSRSLCGFSAWRSSPPERSLKIPQPHRSRWPQRCPYRYWIAGSRWSYGWLDRYLRTRKIISCQNMCIIHTFQTFWSLFLFREWKNSPLISEYIVQVSTEILTSAHAGLEQDKAQRSLIAPIYTIDRTSVVLFQWTHTLLKVQSMIPKSWIPRMCLCKII